MCRGDARPPTFAVNKQLLCELHNRRPTCSLELEHAPDKLVCFGSLFCFLTQPGLSTITRTMLMPKQKKERKEEKCAGSTAIDVNRLLFTTEKRTLRAEAPRVLSTKASLKILTKFPR